jgi:hypothetical protein
MELWIGIRFEYGDWVFVLGGVFMRSASEESIHCYTNYARLPLLQVQRKLQGDEERKSNEWMGTTGHRDNDGQKQ